MLPRMQVLVDEAVLDRILELGKASRRGEAVKPEDVYWLADLTCKLLLGMWSGRLRVVPGSGSSSVH